MRLLSDFGAKLVCTKLEKDHLQLEKKEPYGNADDGLDNAEVFTVVPIGDENWTDIDVIGYILWTVYDHSCTHLAFQITAECRNYPRPKRPPAY